MRVILAILVGVYCMTTMPAFAEICCKDVVGCSTAQYKDIRANKEGKKASTIHMQICCVHAGQNLTPSVLIMDRTIGGETYTHLADNISLRWTDFPLSKPPAA